ncbi:MAG: NADH-quinone oxidoreductase subunit NuoH [Gemmatimonadetes bacterium]|nr:NADH-quinone oxidoreductase subunit NuoH [Gemmatimonadota bacterium]
MTPVGLEINFYLLLVIKILAVTGVMLGGVLPVIYAELKIGAHMQSRVGPYYAGGRWGWAQPMADGLKFFQKEDLVPAAADRQVYKYAPYLLMVSTLAVFVIVPFSPELIAADLDLGIFFALAISSLSTLGVLMAGWSSGNKYSLIGGLRAAAQIIAYELPLVLAVIGVVIQAGTLSMVGIVEAQIDMGVPFLVGGQVVGFVIFFIAALAELNRTPFDLPFAESELVMGYVTEYSGFRFAVFFLAEYAGVVAISAITATLFLGGYGFWGLDSSVFGPFVLAAKIGIVAFLMIWIRWTWPRLREDQLQTMAWKWLIPISLANILVTAVFKVVF